MNIHTAHPTQQLTIARTILQQTTSKVTKITATINIRAQDLNTTRYHTRRALNNGGAQETTAQVTQFRQAKVNALLHVGCLVVGDDTLGVSGRSQQEEECSGEKTRDGHHLVGVFVCWIGRWLVL